MSLPSTWRAGAAALLLAAPLALTGCGVQTSVPANLAAPVGNGASLNGTVTPASNGISSAVTFVGTVMTSDGFTLYRYAKDRATPPTSACTGTCTASWPPVAADQLPVPYGVDAKLLGSVVRPDGSKQLTVAGWPVYRYIKDTAPGFVNGPGGLWRAVGADGEPLPITAASAKPTAAPAPAKAAPAASKPPAVAPTKARVAPPRVAPTKAPAVAPTTVRDAPGTSSTD
jgi:predicted lipoprotein with Yx(FWY)xxD motif